MTALALLASAALVLMTSYLHRATLDLGGAIESVRATRAIRADLIAHSRTREPGARRSLEVISVSDRGVGISEEDRNQLFEPFRRLGQSQESIPGVGMGLFVVRRIVEAHQGRVEVESEPGRGSTFRVRLPLAQASRAEGRGDRRRIRQSGRAGDRTSRQSASAGRGPRA